MSTIQIRPEKDGFFCYIGKKTVYIDKKLYLDV